MKSHWVEHKGKRVFIAEYARFGADSAALRREGDAIIETLLKEPPDSVLVISNVEGTDSSLANIKILSDILPHTNKVVHRRCAVGMEGMAWRLIGMFNKLTGRAKLMPFVKMEEALDWIVQDEF
jgi:hypothetical protein